MRKFNQTISVEVEVDSIANQLLNTINPEFKHREPLVEAIIGTALNNRDAVSHIYSALNGHLPEINYKVGDVVNCTATTYMYFSEQSRTKRDSERSELGRVVIKKIDPYRDNPLCVEFDYYDMDGSVRKDTTWVKMRQCEQIVKGESECSDQSIYKYEDIFK